MKSVGFLNLPGWQGELQKILTKNSLESILRAPVAGSENVEYPWAALETEEFLSAVETGIHFAGGSAVKSWTKKVITTDSSVASDRILKGLFNSTYFYGAIGGTFSFFKMLGEDFSSPGIKRIIVQNDAVSGYVLSRVEKFGKTIEEATHEAQWDGIATENPNPHLHGMVTRNRLSLQMAEAFNVFTAPENIFCEGISTLSPEDVLISKELNCSIRLLGIGEIEDGEIKACVGPCIIPDKYFLAQARGGSEIIYAQDVNGGSQVFACPGTSNEQIIRGVLSDLFSAECKKKKPIVLQSRCSSIPGKFYIRISLVNLADTLSQICGIFVENSIEIESIFQDFKKLVSRETDDSELEAVLFTGETSNEKIADVCRIIGEKARLATVKSCFRFIR